MGRRHGMVDLDTRLQTMVEAQLITAETAREHAKTPARITDVG
jgi:Tfp pilus assembly pilus retraction ATPase PilT